MFPTWVTWLKHSQFEIEVSFFFHVSFSTWVKWLKHFQFEIEISNIINSEFCSIRTDVSNVHLIKCYQTFSTWVKWLKHSQFEVVVPNFLHVSFSNVLELGKMDSQCETDGSNFLDVSNCSQNVSS